MVAVLTAGSDWRKTVAESPPERQHRRPDQLRGLGERSLAEFPPVTRPVLRPALLPVLRLALQSVLQQWHQQALQPEQQAPRPLLQLGVRPLWREFQKWQEGPVGFQPRFPSAPGLLSVLPVGDPVQWAGVGPLPEKRVESVPQESPVARQPEATPVQPGRVRPASLRAPGIMPGASTCPCFLTGYFCFSLPWPSSFLPVILSAKTSTPASLDTCSTNSCIFFVSYSFCSFLRM